MDYSLFLVVTYNPRYIEKNPGEFQKNKGKFGEYIETSEKAALTTELEEYQK
jgi:hypothetical protein